jgi:hypothetical protein
MLTMPSPGSGAPNSPRPKNWSAEMMAVRLRIRPSMNHDTVNVTALGHEVSGSCILARPVSDMGASMSSPIMPAARGSITNLAPLHHEPGVRPAKNTRSARFKNHSFSYDIGQS